MPFVTKPERFSSDIIIPGRVSDPHGFVTEHREIDLPGGLQMVHFSVTGLRQLASRYPQIGLVPEASFDEAVRVAAEAMAEAEQLRAQVAALEARQERIAGFAADGFKVQKVLGRPKEKE